MSVKHSLLIILALSLFRPGNSIGRRTRARRALSPELMSDDDSEDSDYTEKVHRKPPRRFPSKTLEPENLKSTHQGSINEVFDNLKAVEVDELHDKELEKLKSEEFDELMSKKYEELHDKELQDLKTKEYEELLRKETEDSKSKELEDLKTKGLERLKSKKLEDLKSEESESSKTEESDRPKYIKSSVKLDRVTEMMSEYLSKNTVDSKKFCKYDLESCMVFINAYTERCLNGDCFTLDNAPVVALPNGLKINLPFLNQYAFALGVFEDSGAWQKSKFYNLYRKIKNRIYRSEERTIESFNSKMTRINFGKTNFGNDFNRMILTEVLYKATLHYLAYLADSPLAKFMNKWKLMRFFFRLRQTSWLTRAAKNVAKSKTLEIGMRDLQMVIDSYLLYLKVSGVVEPERLTISYSKLVKHSIMKVLGTKVVSALMSDYILTMPPLLSDFCKNGSSDKQPLEKNTVPYASVNCRDMVTDYLERCQDGNCITLDNRTLLDGKDYLNVDLPDLDQVNVAVTIFVNSRAHKNLILDFIFRRKSRITQDQFIDRVYNENLKVLKFNNRDHEMLGRYLYYDTLYFKIRSLKNRIKLFFSKKIETQLRSFLEPLVKSNPVRINKVKLGLIFAAYRNYLFENNFSKDRDKLISFVQVCHEVFMSFTDGNFVGGKKKKKSKHLEQEEGTPEEVEFDYERENNRMYENEGFGLDSTVQTKSHNKPTKLEDTEEFMEDEY
ncbi:rhoptry-associated protein, putative [Theileria annulata]|uniref:Rhoptry-associated protein, putative n=1 Tax=Theileria annulata TaxID=5874 RepID=Q4UHN7_THEAN|nr:rhoptry-associated protein, putative [Theileria annulata]CAI73402.1 rhoptry-associated protein, putative [Theileria annulata]|eukprot:XP_954079.1 rhoptry-associated protein, putative [Theileria annulata]